jgi:uracil-DNA glycosylase family 4
MFTGDRSGDFMFDVLHELGFASQPTSLSSNDGLRLTDVYVCAVNRCAPPGNKPTPEERDNCLPFLVRELRQLSRARTIVCLGAYAWDGALRAVAELGSLPAGRARPRFGHGTQAKVGEYTILGTFHPSQQNTFTGRLTRQMFLDIFTRARLLASIGTGP